MAYCKSIACGVYEYFLKIGCSEYIFLICFYYFVDFGITNRNFSLVVINIRDLANFIVFS